MEKKNCWEIKKCGREPKGIHTASGVCPAAVETRLDGAHGGKNAGRSCWVVASTFCGGEEQGSFAKKYHNCESCNFFQQVKKDEGPRFQYSITLLSRLREPQPA